MTDTQYPVLVYGTLRPGHSNYGYFLEGKTIFEQDVQVEGFTMHALPDADFPYLVQGGKTVTGTLVYLLSEEYNEVLRQLDMLEGFYEEGHPYNHYERILHAFTVDGLKRKAWLYVASNQIHATVSTSIPVLVEGDWAVHVLANKKLGEEQKLRSSPSLTPAG
jgi:gamma-glutamylcyclotransferase (GGCT)/AIG2-like uncharacterized protein YtfP